MFADYLEWYAFPTPTKYHSVDHFDFDSRLERIVATSTKDDLVRQQFRIELVSVPQQARFQVSYQLPDDLTNELRERVTSCFFPELLLEVTRSIEDSCQKCYGADWRWHAYDSRPHVTELWERPPPQHNNWTAAHTIADNSLSHFPLWSQQFLGALPPILGPKVTVTHSYNDGSSSAGAYVLHEDFDAWKRLDPSCSRVIDLVYGITNGSPLSIRRASRLLHKAEARVSRVAKYGQMKLGWQPRLRNFSFR